MEAKTERRIAFIHEYFPAGGAEKVTSDVGAYLSRHGYKCYVFTLHLREEKLSASDREAFTFIPLPDGDLFSEENTRFICAQIDKHAIGIFDTSILSLGGLDLIRKHTRAKVVFELHAIPFWEKINSLSILRNRVDESGSLTRKIRWYLEKRPRYWITGRYGRKLRKRYRNVYAHCDVFAVLCEEYREMLIKRLKLPPQDHHIEVFHNFLRPREYPDSGKKKEVLYMGRFSNAQKHVDRLLDIWHMVWREFPDWTLRLVGEGPDADKLKKMTRDLELGNVVFEEYTTDPGAYYQNASILVLTSMFEGWPLAVAEGQQAGVIPVVYNCCAGIEQQVAPDGVNGFLIPKGNKKLFAQRLRQLMSDDRLREQMSRNVVEKAKEYDMERRCRQRMAAFDRLLSDTKTT